jgi:hypothetical protein
MYSAAVVSPTVALSLAELIESNVAVVWSAATQKTSRAGLCPFHNKLLTSSGLVVVACAVILVSPSTDANVMETILVPKAAEAGTYGERLRTYKGRAVEWIAS